MLHKSPILRVEIHKPEVIHLRQSCRRQSMRADASTEIQNLTPYRHALQTQRVGDVIRTAEMPCGQLQQVPGADGVLVKRRGILRAKSSGMQVGQVIGAGR